MTAETLFSICNTVALIGWILLLFSPRAKWAPAFICGLLIPAILAGVYVTLLLVHWGEAQGSFSTLAGVSQLFQNPWILLAGWIHYLAFDLFVGSWEVRDAMRNRTPHLIVVPCLLLTFLFGPVGLLAYLLIRQLTSRSKKLLPID